MGDVDPLNRSVHVRAEDGSIVRRQRAYQNDGWGLPRVDVNDVARLKTERRNRSVHIEHFPHFSFGYAVVAGSGPATHQLSTGIWKGIRVLFGFQQGAL